jgi:hypothetical protein
MMSEAELDQLEAAAEQLVEDLDRDYREASERERELNLKLNYLRELNLRNEVSPKPESAPDAE